jgi:hypothetical protein
MDMQSRENQFTPNERTMKQRKAGMKDRNKQAEKD